MSRNEWVTRTIRTPLPQRQTQGKMMADSIEFQSRQGKQIRNPVASANILRLPAAGSKEWNNLYFVDNAVRLGARQGANRHIAIVTTTTPQRRPLHNIKTGL